MMLQRAPTCSPRPRFVAEKAAQNAVSSGLLISRLTVGNPPCQDRKCTSAATAIAGAVCGRSDRALLAAGSLAVRLPRPSLFVSLTPARWRGHEFGWQIPGFAWARGVVPQGTAREPLGNAQSIDITRLIARFRWFRDFVGGYAHARAHAQARVYVRGVNQGTREPQDYLFRNHMDSGSLSGSRAVPQGTGFVRQVLLSGRWYILGGGNLAQLLELVAIGAVGAKIGGAAAKVFGFSGRSAGAWTSSSTGDRRLGKNGGNPPFSGSGSAIVGSLMLEALPIVARYQGDGAPEHQPSRLARGIEGTPTGSIDQVAQGSPPLPPSARPDPLAPWRSSVPEFGSAIRPAPAARRLPEFLPATRATARSREALSGSTGSGWRLERRDAGLPAAGRGTRRAVGPGAVGAAAGGPCAGLWGSAQRRTVEASGRTAHVN